MGTEEVDGDTRSFVAYREMRPGVVWVDEVHTAEGERRKGVATWMMGAIGMGKRVEMQVLQNEGGAQQAYAKMGLCGGSRYRCVSYSEPQEGYAFWGTREFVVRSGWDPELHGARVQQGGWSELSSEVQQAMVMAVVGTSGQDETRVRATLSGDGEEAGGDGACAGEESRVLVVEHGRRAPLRQPTAVDAGGSGGRGRGRGRGVGARGEVGQGRIVRIRRQRPATSRYAAGALRVMEQARRGRSETGGGEGVT